MTHQTHDGGKPIVKQESGGPKGPSNSAGQERKPGLGGTNHGTCGTQSKG